MVETKPLTVADVARHVGGRLEGDGDRRVTTLSPLDEAGPDAISWLAEAKYRDKAATSRAAAIILPQDADAIADKTLIRVADPDAAMIATLELLAPPVDCVPPGVHPTAVIGEGACVDGAAIGPHVSVGAGSTIGPRTQLHAGVSIGSNVTIGEDCTLFANVVVRERCTLKDRVIIHANSTIGTDGFSYVLRDGTHRKVPQIGTVIIQNDVEIGSCTAIDRARSGATVIGQGTKIDNLVQVGHNVRTGKHCILVAGVGISGSVLMGDYCVFAGHSGASDHCTIGCGVQIATKSVITRDMPDGVTLRGVPAIDISQYNREAAAVRKLPEALKMIRGLTKRIEALEQERRPQE
jgi:UDP-3-O-[3-hydroxymyristoyl] glucosamine N-acyltransferase